MISYTYDDNNYFHCDIAARDHDHAATLKKRIDTKPAVRADKKAGDRFLPADTFCFMRFIVAFSRHSRGFPGGLDDAEEWGTNGEIALTVARQLTLEFDTRFDTRNI
ncbi:hypothetical protein ACFOTA_22115 [Chitinophaga sp. GCM10012297]|uniref:Uncharacterized protein n=2 Tax=Chitinophagaceae TaxID=563835 RepID=A0ABS3YJU3_9BACT|nr:hypothetical protein [Chitinophaga chungangae]